MLGGMDMKFNRILILLTFALVLVLAACGNDDESTDKTTDSGTETETATDTNTNTETDNAQGGELVIEVLSEADELDPHGSNDVPSSNVQRNLYVTLKQVISSRY